MWSFQNSITLYEDTFGNEKRLEDTFGNDKNFSKLYLNSCIGIDVQKGV